MIFVTVGAQMAFDRLVRAVDAWAGRNRSANVFAQIGPSTYRPEHITATGFLDPLEFRKRVGKSQLIVAHAGMGSILTALELGKPIIVMPRSGALGETRNDHQIATAMHFARQGRVTPTFSELELFDALDRGELIQPAEVIDGKASHRLLDAIRRFIDDGQNTISATAQVSVTPSGL